MEQKIIDALVEKLGTLFPEITAYDVKMDMEVKPPMFVIDCYDRSRSDRITHGGFFYTYFFEVVFFPGHDEPELAGRDIELELQQAVWLFGDKYRGDDIRIASTDGGLHLYFSVTVPLAHVGELPPEISEIRTEVDVNEQQVSTQTIKIPS